MAAFSLALDPGARARLRVARALEGGALRGGAARAIARAWGAFADRSLARPLAWPGEARVVAVGGATLGGSGKTPLAIACARALAEGGVGRVALVGHGYRARPGRARIVAPDDDVACVGDEAIVAARALGSALRVEVIVGPSRAEALAFAARRADIVVLDGVLQTAPRRASLSLLALDAASPWGAGEIVPCGDLRASRAALLAACDGAVLVGAENDDADGAPWTASIRARGALLSGDLLSWATLSALRVGLFVALARPGRLVASLRRHAVVPARVVQAPDHGCSPKALARIVADRSVQVWLASPKCALHLEAAGVPHATLEHDVVVGPALRRALFHRVASPLLRSPHVAPA